ncbi:3-deoxy-7-phosphoheptulonate synthase [Flavobacterium rakeshii]|uniref:3-deoxy-7-phosphoheptulonate synthase n=1 Tax=Flavobacterium rakeshii TaxID=1038845 RepID=A0A6N8HF95_9FLAO|nr:3-deoxy-7-phosphoheptulonate synthase [Flavobacterium rakeshii]MUV04394.1 3-deoxy-7-phosphoheptulonate synthase [Flavobacterium rakeshii]
MILQLEHNTKSKDILSLTETITGLGYKSTHVKTQRENYLICIGNKEIDIRQLGHLPVVKDIHRVSDQYKLVSRKWKTNYTSINLGDDVYIGGKEKTIIAGPCSIESEDQAESIAEHLSQQGIKIMRGGVFKPRSSPYAFRGLGLEGMKLFHNACKKRGIKIITEVMQASQIEELYPYIDIFQVGARNSQNYNLLDALGESDKPVMIKRGISGSIDELLCSAEYVFSAGNEDIILCERGIRTFETSYRNTFDINAIQVLKDKTHLPVLADPSHGVGIRDYVPGIAMAAIVAGADGVIYEVHPSPEKALSDGQQTLNFQESEALIQKIKVLEKL